MKPAGRATPRGSATGASPTAKPMRKWAFTRVGVSRPISSPRWPPACNCRAGASHRRQAAFAILCLQFLDRRFPRVDCEDDIIVGMRQRNVVFRLALEDAALAQQRVKPAQQLRV